MQIEELRQRLRALGANPRHEHRVLRLWSQALPQTHGSRPIENFLPTTLRQALPELERELAALATVHSEHPGEDGSQRRVVALADGQLVESVHMPPGRTPALCVSTQVGCAVGCVFCMTGTTGLIRQLGSAEIVAQVALARQRRPVQRVVFMGMGEPAHNLDNVLEAIDLLGTAGNIGHKNLVFSTVGDPRAFEALLSRGEGQVRPALALSLHTTRAELRARLLPRAPRMSPEELVDVGERYARASGYPIQYQWTLLEGINDTDEEVEGLVRLLHGKYAILNLIPYNTVEGMPYRRPDTAQAVELARQLHQRGILTKLRQSAGQDVDGGCGQLRARAAGERRVISVRST
ncbi:RNA methyltransferase [Rhodoferax sp. BAB1]|uniref:RNA methyltransferase n=1 Tax=Rhodoferax sp. BAB1 TaxID=2741720 RepID=UPI0015776381|nr:RNA methyltransferase [Rhodoferax sp. BAB1]QKO23288.1 RNA methyltransferase [Rhodoferax sp. BAB1]